MSCERADERSQSATVVLLVEDQPLIALVAQSTLEEAGYRTVVVPDGSSALQQLEEGFRPSVLITDIRLGDGPDGWELAAHARKHDPQLPVVYMSGDSGQESSRAVPGGMMLQKPVSATHLISAVEASARPKHIMA